jgi:hypothetical protein
MLVFLTSWKEVGLKSKSQTQSLAPEGNSHAALSAPVISTKGRVSRPALHQNGLVQSGGRVVSVRTADPRERIA